MRRNWRAILTVAAVAISAVSALALPPPPLPFQVKIDDKKKSDDKRIEDGRETTENVTFVAMLVNPTGAKGFPGVKLRLYVMAIEYTESNIKTVPTVRWPFDSEAFDLAAGEKGKSVTLTQQPFVSSEQRVEIEGEKGKMRQGEKYEGYVLEIWQGDKLLGTISKGGKDVLRV